MRKRDELTNPNGCMFRARDNEMTFVLLGRDAAAPLAIRAWIAERVRLGRNLPDDPQIVEAEQCARIMEAERLDECPGHGRGGMRPQCCSRPGEYNGFGSDGPTILTCPKGCSCHD